MTSLSQVGEWAASLRAEQIPDGVHRRVRAQVLSMLAAAHAAVHSRAFGAVASAVAKWGPGDSPIVATGARVDLHASLLANAAASMAFDYDDYLFLGHTGHSAVWTPLLLGAQIDAAPEDVLAAIVAANEVAGRLGAACFYGPQNGQLWSFIHLAGAAVAASRVMRLDAGRTAHALAIALSQPNYALYPGLMGCEAKLLTAATPAVAGLQAAQLAAEGLTGRLDVLDDPRGFLAHFSFHPQPHMLTGWGEAWVSETIAIKPYPGCAYIDAAIDAVRELLRTASGSVKPDQVTEVDVDATLLTLGMDRLGWRGGPFGPVDVNFSIPLSVSIALLEGDLTA
ncbi:MAG: MmgE/PrpD family protein, partial [Planctomycetota bacterium]